MEDPDPNTKSKESSASDVINGNWILKRKRKKTVSTPNGDKNDSMPSESRATTSSKCKIEKENSLDRSPSTQKENDGNYHECVKCELGGDLLCCDTCPQTYHLACLDPPLEQIPNGKWRCPKCRRKNDSGDAGPTSKRAKTKKTKSRSKSEKSDSKASRIRGKKKSSNGSRDGSSSCLNHKTGNDSDSNDTEPPSPAKAEAAAAAVAPPKGAESKRKRKRKTVAASKTAAPKAAKRKRKIPFDGVKKIVTTEDGSPKRESEKPRRRRTLVKHGKTKSLSKNDMGSKIGDVRPKDEVVLDDDANEAHKVDEVMDSPKHDKIQQVDRVLGCRIQETERNSASTAETAAAPSQSPVAAVDNRQNGPPEKPLSHNTTLDVAGEAETVTAVEKTPVDDANVPVPDVSSKTADERRESGGTVSYEFLVKWVGRSHLHNSWVSETELKALAKRKLDNYKAKYGTAAINVCEERWKRPQRVIATRPSASGDGSKEFLVKWTGLPYDECTWERADEPAIAESSRLVESFERFERETAERADAENETPRGKKTDAVTLAEQPRELGGTLFPHQLEALNWLRRCWCKSKNVILADEMGLGKTISACAFLSSLYSEFRARLPCLVLVPLSTMPNWMSEFSVWAPHLNVVEYHGCARARALMREYEWHAARADKRAAAHKFNVLLTTYEMVLADSAHLRSVPWEVLIVDEGHRLKNSGSKLFGLLNTFSFQHRVLLTGTPLQNNIGEMYNLLNFLQPVSFPSLTSFEEKFQDLTTAEKVDELKKLVAPHMLRRLKKDAMQNIPPKTERMVPVELSSIQAEYYRAMLTKNYQILRNVGKGIPQQSMLNIVMQLRKVCNHPYLIPGTEPESGSVEFLHDMRIKASAKLSLLHSMLKVLHREGHRVLIFSQMTKLLDILEDYLNVEFGPKTFERVDGSVSVADRQTAIARFNNDRSRFVFLLSTRSCGLGINLATADTVIIYDSDFNPHADIQAMNRAHRIGQSKRLLVYRLVVRASVEERILQLAKKKLMLDQLFVNKSGSQKEVEDILRWGTEELFSDSPAAAAAVEVEHKGKRRTGGLGDVYQDKCTDGNPMVVWDEAAIMKLLDRTNLDAGSTENAEGDSETDMLGSVKSLDWNDEPTEEQPGTEPLVEVSDDTSVHNSEKKDENSGNVAEENEWDRLLRVRWEKYQSEEEAALGRGKRQRKAVSYREAYAPQSIQAFPENRDEEPEPEPEREYTPAGRALKTKFARLRARQKERLVRSKAIRESLLTMVHRAQSSGPAENPPALDDAGQPRDETDSRKGRNRNLVAVLGLCAPNSNLMESGQRNVSRAFGRNRRGGMGRFELASCSQTSNETDPRARDSTGCKTEHFDASGPSDPHFHRRPTAGVPPFTSHVPVPPEVSGDGLSRRHEKMPLPKSPFDGAPPLLAKLPFPVSHPQPDFFPNLTLGRSIGESSGSLQDFSTIPLLPNLGFPKDMPPMYKHPPTEVPLPPPLPMLGLGQMLPPFSSLPENHRRVLENIMMRTGTGPGNPLKRKLVRDFWSEEELDSLWIGVRRHGRGGWDTMLRDPKLRFSRFRTAEELAARWEEEQLKILDGPPPRKQPRAMKSGKSPPVFPGISDGMMKRALHRSRFSAGPPSFPPQLIDMKLGSDYPTEKTEPPGPQNERFPPVPPWNPNGFRAESSFGTPTFGSLGLNGSGTFDSQKAPTFFNLYLNSFRRPESGKVPDLYKGKNVIDPTGGGSSSENKLPHWLREAVSIPTPRPEQEPEPVPEPKLPPTVSAIAESVRLLYGAEKPTIPPFVSPGLPPARPKDPRGVFKKKKGSSSHGSGIHHQPPPDVGGTKPGSPETEPELNLATPVDQVPVEAPETSVGEGSKQMGSGDSGGDRAAVSSEETVSDDQAAEAEAES